MGVVLFGKLKGDAEAPREVVTGYDPCDKCKKNISQGCWCIEVHDHPTNRGRVPMQKQGDKELYPTGRFHVLKHEAAARIFESNGITEETQVILIDKGLFDWIQKQHKQYMRPKRKLAKKPSTWPIKKEEKSV